MTEDIAEKICNQLCDLKYDYRSPSMNNSYRKNFIDNQEAFKPLCIGIINSEVMNLKTEISKLEAKVFAYEAILQNSNFKMAIIDDRCSTAQSESIARQIGEQQTRRTTS